MKKSRMNSFRTRCWIPEPLYNEVMKLPHKFLNVSSVKNNRISAKINDLMIIALLHNNDIASNDKIYNNFVDENAKGLPNKSYDLDIWGNLFEWVMNAYINKARSQAQFEYDNELEKKGKVNAKTKAKCNASLTQAQFFRRLLVDAVLIFDLPNYNLELDYLPPPYTFHGSKNERMCNKKKEILTDVLKKPNMIYVEPFTGAASLFFSLPLVEGWKYILNDLNKHRVNFLRVIQHQPYELMDILIDREYTPEKYAKQKDSKGKKVKNIHKTLLNGRIKRFKFKYYLSPVNRTNLRNNLRIKSAADFFIDQNHSRIDMAQSDAFYADVAMIPLLSAKLNKANVEITNMNALNIMKTFILPNTIQLIDPPYIGTEDSCWAEELDLLDSLQIYEKDDKDLHEDENFIPTKKKRMVRTAKEKEEIANKFHQSIANSMIKMTENGCDFIYYCRTTCPIGIKTNRTTEDKKIQDRIDKLFIKNENYYHVYRFYLDKKTTECFITSFSHKDSDEYTNSISTYKEHGKPLIKNSKNNELI